MLYIRVDIPKTYILENIVQERVYIEPSIKYYTHLCSDAIRSKIREMLDRPITSLHVDVFHLDDGTQPEVFLMEYDKLITESMSSVVDVVIATCFEVRNKENWLIPLVWEPSIGK